MGFVDFRKALEEQKQKFGKDWIYRKLYRQQAQVSALRKGACNLCSFHTEALYPVLMEVCRDCAENFIKRGEKIKLVKKNYYIFSKECVWCRKNKSQHFYINPNICEKCMEKLYRKWRKGF